MHINSGSKHIKIYQKTRSIHPPARKKNKKKSRITICKSVEKQVKPRVKRQSDHPSESSKRRCTNLHSIALNQTGQLYFLPENAFEHGRVISPPSAITCKYLDQHQRDCLIIKESGIHNQGVFLRDGCNTVQKNQIVAVYDGHPLRMRLLDDDERASAGFSLTLNHEKWLTWYIEGYQPKLCCRLPCYQASMSKIYYFDNSSREVRLGIDAIDSQMPISNMNHSDRANIMLVSCLDPKWIRSNSTEETIVDPYIPKDAFCLLAVARKDIHPSEELLTDYDKKFRSKAPNSYFWGADDYYYPQLSFFPVSLSFSMQGAQVSIHGNPIKEQDYFTEECKDKIVSLTQYPDFLERCVEEIDGVYINPLTGDKKWTPGGLQYLCELAGIFIPHKAQYKYLTYLFHCTNSDGVLDNHGVNYLAGALKQHDLNPPEKRMHSVQDVIDYLVKLRKEIRRSKKSGDTKMKLNFLDEQIKVIFSLLKNGDFYCLAWDITSLLNTEPNLDSEIGDNFQLLFANNGNTESQKINIVSIITTTKNDLTSRGFNNDIVFSRIVDNLNRTRTAPEELWPEQFRPRPWRRAHIPCVYGLMNKMSEPGIDVNNDFDIIACYRTDSTEYFEAIKRQIINQLDSGMAMDALIHQMSNTGFRGRSGSGKRVDYHVCSYLIPHVTGIPVALSDTSKWYDLTAEHWKLLGVSQDRKPPLKETIERFLRGGASKTYHATISAICKSYKHLWAEVPHIKPGIKTLPSSPCTSPILNYLMRYSNAEVPDKLAKIHRWTPQDTLMVCSADTPPYKEAMVLFLSECVDQFRNAQDIAQLLSSGHMHSYSENLKALHRPELPEALTREGYSTWTPEAVERLFQHEEIAIPENFVLHPSDEMYLKGVVQDWMNNGTKTSAKSVEHLLSHRLQTQKKTAAKLARFLGLSEESIQNGSRSALRIILTKLEISESRLPKKEKEKLIVRPSDGLEAYPIGSIEWKEDLHAVINYYLERGHTLSYIVCCLNRGDKNSHHGLNFKAVPLIDNHDHTVSKRATGKWTYENLLTFLIPLHGDLQSLMKKYSASALCLALEQSVYSSGEKISLADGYLIDRMLSPLYISSGSAEDSNRFRKMSPNNLQLLPKPVGTKAWRERYFALKKLEQRSNGT